METIKDMERINGAELVAEFLAKPSAPSRLIENELCHQLALGIWKGMASVSKHWNRQEHEDVSQEGMVCAFKKLHTWSRQGKLFSWAFKIGQNTAINWLEKEKRRQHISLDDIDVPPIDRRPTPEELLAGESKIAQINEFISNEVPPELRKAFLAHLNGQARSLSEAAEQFDLWPSDLFRWVKGNPVRYKKFEALLSTDQATRDAINWLHRKAEAEGKNLYGSGGPDSTA